MSRCSLMVAALALVLMPALIPAAEAVTPAAPTEQQIFFAMKVRPLLREKCFACHGEDRQEIEGGFDMTSRTALLKGGESGEVAIIPGDPNKSPAFIAVTWADDDLQMPPKENDRLTTEQIEVLSKWIADGAQWFDGELPQAQVDQWNKQYADGVTVPTSGGLAADWTNRRYELGSIWAFMPVEKVQPPNGVASHPIDAFIDAKLKERGLEPAGRADKLTLIRRVTYDLTGLPPTPQEIADFIADDSPDAWETLVDRLLASPQYGEQWARHWLDVVRYADTSGFSNDHARPTAWRYRDYVIRAFNNDKPYDKFIIEQIAGDELNPDDPAPEMLVATGYLRMGPWEHTGMSVAAVTRQQFLDDVTNAVGVTFLGQGMACAKCHDHKFDPIPTRDYYSFQAIFAPTQFAEREAPFLPGEKLSIGPEDAIEKQRIQTLLDETNAARAALDLKQRKAQQAMLKERGIEIELSKINRYLREQERAHPEIRHAGLTYQELGVRKVLAKRIDYLERQLLRFEPIALSVYNGPERTYNSNQPMVKMPGPQQREGPADTTHILIGGSIEAPADEVEPGVLSAVVQLSDVGEGWGEIPQTSDGRRLALATWIADPRNPLTTRVIVNRIWQHHFAGKGIVATPNNFGVMGAKPTHPQLLDYLATWFVDNGWSIKKLHKLILMSETYQRSGRPIDAAKVREEDPNNELLSFYPPRRLTAEELRDSMLALSGELNLQMGGPAIFPEINMEVALQPLHVMGSTAPAYQPSPLPQQRHRRTIYAYVYRNKPDPMLEVFNKPGSENSCEMRDATTVTPQVFALFNGQRTYDRALAMARRLEESSDDLKQQIEAAFRLVYGRAATADEMNAAISHVQKMTQHHRSHDPVKVEMPTTVTREMVEEMTGEAFTWDEELDIFARGTFVPDLKPSDVAPHTRALAELCLVLLNSNPFVYVY